MEIKKFNFIKDEPTMPGKPGYFDFYHKSFSPALKDMILSDSCPHTIGLFSKWGTGKSSIIDQLDIDLKNEKSAKAHVVIFDAWKYQEDSLRRTFLIKLEAFIREKGYDVPSDILSALYKKKSTSVATEQEVPNETAPKKNWFRRMCSQYGPVALFLIIPFLLSATFYIWGMYSPTNKFVIGAKSALAYVNGLAWLSVIAAIFLKPVVDEVLKKITSKIFESTKTYTEIRTQVEDEDRLNSPEQFEQVFMDLVDCIKDGKLVVVFDNIDRVQGDIALKILSTIKTFLEVGKSKVIFLVPCDAPAINKQIRAFYNNQEEDPDFDESEYLKKLFNVVINTPEFIDQDLQEYTSSLIDQTGEDIQKIIKNDKVLSVITKAFKNNPREVKQFMNNLVSAVLVASKTEVADEILSEENVGYFTKVTVLKQKFPKAYKKLKEKWNEPEKIVEAKDPDVALRDFMTLTSTITTNDAEPFIYFKKPKIEADLKDAKSIRKSLVDGNIEEFEKLAGAEDKKKLVQYVAMLLQNYKGQARILPAIFKTQIQAFSNMKETETNTTSYLDAFVDTLELIWNIYLELPVTPVFEMLPKLHGEKRNAVIDRYIAVLANEEIKLDTHTAFLHNLIDEFVKNFGLLSDDQKQKIVEALQQNFGSRSDVLLKFDTTETQKNFIDPEILRKIIQEALTNKTLKSFMPLISAYKQFILDANLGLTLLQRTHQFMSSENAETPSTTAGKTEFYGNIVTLFSSFKSHLKDIPEADQREIFNNLQNAFNQSGAEDGTRKKVVTLLRWTETSMSNDSVKNQARDLINNFISQASKGALENVLTYWNESSRISFIKDHFDQIQTRSLNDDGILSLVYENGSEDQKMSLIRHIINNKPDHGIAFLQSLGEKLPMRQEVIKSLLTKAQALSIQQRVSIFQFLKGKIAKNDDVNLKQSAIKQFYEYLKSDDQAMVQFGAVMLTEAFLSDTDEREIAKEMFDFYNTRSSRVQQSDLPALEHLVNIESKLQGPLKEKLVFLLLSNITPDRQFEIQKPIINLIQKMNPSTDDYEKDFSDLVQRLLTWPDSGQKDQVVKDVAELLKSIPGSKAKEYLEKIKSLIKSEA